MPTDDIVKPADDIAHLRVSLYNNKGDYYGRMFAVKTMGLGKVVLGGIRIWFCS